MPGIPKEVIEYKLGIDLGFKLIKQKEKNIHTGEAWDHSGRG
jgi:hypothetical protein